MDGHNSSRREFLRNSVGTASVGMLSGAPLQVGVAGGMHAGPPYRHIHLDFHTSPTITGVGENFKAEEFAATLKEAYVNSIAIFAKCHHGMSYYPTKVGVRHPNLKFDLFGESLEACHRVGIRAVAYISTMYDQWAYNHHGDWRVLNPDGKVEEFKGLGRVCVNTGLLDYLATQADEILRQYPVDGIFYDNMGYQTSGCCCASCELERDKLGLDSRNAADRSRHSQQVLLRAAERLSGIARDRRPKGSIVFNGRTDHVTHIEFESLPGKGGYGGLSVAGRSRRNLGLPVMVMTGSFHRSWGDFGTVRTQAALDFECFNALALGLGCIIGDHMHPRGRLTKVAYERIGHTFRSVAEKELWCRDAKPVTEIGLLTSSLRERGAGGNSLAGATRILDELHQQFDIIDPSADLSRFTVLVLPDSFRVDDALQRKLNAHLSRGAKLLLSHESGLDPEGKKFVLPVGLDYQGPWQHEVQYIEVVGPMARELPPLVEMAYEKGSAVKANGAEVLGRAWLPYFDKNYKQFQVEQTPFAKPTEFVTVGRNGNIIYIATPIFRDYRNQAYPFHRQLVGSCLRRLLDKPLVIAELPTTAIVTVMGQPNRRIVHLLHYIPLRRAPELEVVEDVIPLHDVQFALRLERQPTKVYLAPENRTIASAWKDGYAHVQVPVVKGHQMVVFE